MRLAMYFDYYKVCVFLPRGDGAPGLHPTLWGGVRFRVDDGWTADRLFTLGVQGWKGVSFPRWQPPQTRRDEGCNILNLKQTKIYVYIYNV